MSIVTTSTDREKLPSHTDEQLIEKFAVVATQFAALLTHPEIQQFIRLTPQDTATLNQILTKIALSMNSSRETH